MSKWKSVFWGGVQQHHREQHLEHLEQFMEQRIGGTRIAIGHHSKVSHGCNYLLDSLRETTINIIIIIIIAIS